MNAFFFPNKGFILSKRVPEETDGLLLRKNRKRMLRHSGIGSSGNGKLKTVKMKIKHTSLKRPLVKHDH